MTNGGVDVFVHRGDTTPDGDIWALVYNEGRDEGFGGVGQTVSEALRCLADQLDEEKVEFEL